MGIPWDGMGQASIAMGWDGMRQKNMSHGQACVAYLEIGSTFIRRNGELETT